MYYVYVLYSIADHKFYIGFSHNLTQRYLEHVIGKVPATRRRRPLKLVYYEAALDRSKATLREKYFKTGFGRRFLKTRV